MPENTKAVVKALRGHIKFHISVAFVALMAAMMLGSCNSDSDNSFGNYTEASDLSAVTVKAFSLQADRKVLNNLDSVFFAIDLVNAQVFNPDSLPRFTRTDSLMVTLSTAEVSVAQLKFRSTTTRNDTVVDFLKDPNEKINFSDGPVILHLESTDGQTKRDYTIKVNVHLMAPDSLYWDQTASRPLPSSLPNVVAQKTVRFKEQAVCLTTSPNAADYSIAFADDPSAEWNMGKPVFPTKVRIETFTAADDALYILADDGTLFTSPDGLAWSATEEHWQAITAPYGDHVLGLKNDGTGLHHAVYPASLTLADTSVAQGFPVSGNSQSVVLHTKWAQNNQVITVGGQTVGGSLTGAAWAFDGVRWAQIGKGLPAADGYILTPYTVCRTDTVSWRTIKTDVLLAIGGREANDTCSRAVYLSSDMGMNWRKADRQVQLPDYIPATSGADALVFDLTLTASRSASSAVWRPWGVSRAVAPITQWECPFIYLFGGLTDAHTLQPLVWRGVINHLSFKPLQ